MKKNKYIVMIVGRGQGKLRFIRNVDLKAVGEIIAFCAITTKKKK